MDIDQIKMIRLDLGINLTYFLPWNFTVLCTTTTILGGWVVGWMVRKIDNKDHLSPAKAEIGAELGKNINEQIALLI